MDACAGWNRYREQTGDLPARPVRDAFEREAVAVAAGTLTVEALHKFVQRYEQARETERESRRQKRHPILPDLRLQALAEVFAVEASRDPRVVEFRNEYLVDGLLRPEEVRAWLLGVLPADQWEWQTAEGVPYGGLRVGDVQPADETPTGYRYTEGDDLDADLIPKPWKSVVDRIGWLAGELAEKYGWTYWPAVVFLPSGLAPPVTAGYVLDRQLQSLEEYRSRRVWSGEPAAFLPRVVLDVPLMFGAEEVAAIYAKARDEALDSLDKSRKRGRRVTDEKTVERAVFATQHNTGITYREALRIWNDARPADPYVGSEKNFGQALGEAYHQVTWQRLDWLGAKRRKGARDE